VGGGNGGEGGAPGPGGGGGWLMCQKQVFFNGQY